MEGYPSSTRCGTLHTTFLDKRARELGRIEPRPRRERILGFFAHRDGAGGDQPLERVVEVLPDQPLQPGVAAGALATEVVPLAVAPDHARRQQHRTARSRPLLPHGRRDAELAGARAANEAAHPGPPPDDGHVTRTWACARRTRCGRAPVPTG